METGTKIITTTKSRAGAGIRLLKHNPNREKDRESYLDVGQNRR